MAERVRLAVVGCGDVARRRYLPALAALRDAAEVVALVDARREVAEAAAREFASATAAAFETVADAVAACDLDAAIDLTPAPFHGAVNAELLGAGLDLYSEKPIASSVAEADQLIETASERGLTFLCAPAIAATRRFGWIKQVVDSGRFGPLTLATAHHADTGPATWREYTGDPRPFYGRGVGPVFDHGVYRLHAMTMLMGPVKRVQATGTISSPTRLVRAGPLAGRTIPVETADHVLMNMEFASGALGQLLTSFAAPGTRAPWLELHFATGSMSFGGESSDKDAPISIYVDDETSAGLEGWIEDVSPPAARDDIELVETGIRHFVRVLRGEEQPLLTAEHARHVLDVILTAYASIEDGCAHEVSTTFRPVGPT